MGIEELADLVGVPVRTVRYYIAEGLLPGPGTRGKGTVYGEEHLLRLRLIRLLADSLGLTVFLVTHDLDTLFSIIDRVIVLSNGRVLGSGTVAELKQFDDPWLNDYFAARASNGETVDGN